jgi:hypothetical protein
MAKKVLTIQPFSFEFEVSYSLIRDAVRVVSSKLKGNDIEIDRIDKNVLFDSGQSIIEVMYDNLKNADLIICDVSNSNSNVMYELGYAHCIKKPVILISRGINDVPLALGTFPILYYDLNLKRNEEFVHHLARMIDDALKNPDNYSTPKVEPPKNKVFISYSHQDRSFLDRLMIHLRPLQKQEVIDLWVDTRLQPGDKWKDEIEKALKIAQVAILLVSADFLASDFIVDNELPPILSNANMKGTKIIPVILKPCRFARDENLSVFMTINAPCSSPLSTLPEFEQERIYDSISERVEECLQTNVIQ